MSDLFQSFLYRPAAAAAGDMSSIPVFGKKGMLDLIDEVFWMLPFSSVRQAKRVRQDNTITDDVWNARSKMIRDEHRCLPNVRVVLERLWKERVTKDIASNAAQRGGGAAVDSDKDVLSMESVESA